MCQLSLTTLLCILYSCIFTANAEQTITWDIYECPRHRRAWHLISSNERLQYANAMHMLNMNGKLLIISKTHHHFTVVEQAHFTSGFFPWHRYLIYELENQIRLISEDYKCFSMPYWDVSHEASCEDNPFILKSYLGGNAMDKKNNNLCVDSLTRREIREQDNAIGILGGFSWTDDGYPLSHVCSRAEKLSNAQKCCLKRSLYTKTNLLPPIGYAHKLRYQYPNYGKGDMNGFCYSTFNAMHNAAHGFIGGSAGVRTHFLSMYSPDDPIFFLLHTWFDFLWTVWMNCHGYDQISPSDLDSHLNAFESFKVADYYPDSGLDDRLIYLDLDGVDWWPSNGDKEYVPTARKMYDISQWNAIYSMGTFIKRSRMTKICSPWNDKWLVDDYKSYGKSQFEEIEGKTIIETFTDIAYGKMESYLKENVNYNGIEEDLYQSLAAKVCIFQRKIRGHKVCYIEDIEVEYEKCSSDLSEVPDTYDISLDEMLNKKGVKGNICLENVRKSEYAWRRTMKSLTALCNGVYDVNIICEHPKLEFDPNQEIEKAMENVDIKDIEMRLAKAFDVPEMERFVGGVDSSSLYIGWAAYGVFLLIAIVVLWFRRNKMMKKKRKKADILMPNYNTAILI